MNKYILGDYIGCGGFGATFKVQLKSTGEVRCLKKINIHDFPDDDFIQEFNIYSKINHPNIIKYYEHFMDENFFCIVVEYADDGDLKSFLSKITAPLPEPHILHISSQIIGAVPYLHERNIIQRS
jgi:NIMA (never in mitosis gene a)-related kinase